jgi:hypothetical protein
MKTRVCTKCGEEKPETAEYFYRHKGCRGGLNTMCKVCIYRAVKRWDTENPEKVRERNRRYYAKNSEKVKEAVRRYRDENPEKVRERQRRWYAENPEKAIEATKRWQAENPEKVRESKKRWRADNHEKVREENKRWRAENPEKVRGSKKRRRDRLAPSYLKDLIAKKYDINYSEIGDELINAKRREIKYYRQLKQLKTT